MGEVKVVVQGTLSGAGHRCHVGVREDNEEGLENITKASQSVSQTSAGFVSSILEDEETHNGSSCPIKAQDREANADDNSCSHEAMKVQVLSGWEPCLTAGVLERASWPGRLGRRREGRCEGRDQRRQGGSLGKMKR